MDQAELFDAICDALNSLESWDYTSFLRWMDELYDGDDEIVNNWTEENLSLLDKDVMRAFNDRADEVDSSN
jgi:hypothetical protein